MSFKIFTLQVTGRIKSVTTIEKQRKALADDYREFKEVQVSDELKAFLELEKMVLSEEFKRNKKDVEELQFKGSEEYNQLNELQRLKKSARIRKYFKVVESADLKKFEAEKDSKRMVDYYSLLGFMTEGQFEKEKKEVFSKVFKGSVEEKHLIDFRRLHKSAAIRAYNELDGSDKLKQHKALEESDKFKKFNEFKNVADQDKQKKKEFKKFKRDAQIKAYFRFEKSRKLRFYHEITGSYELKKYVELKEYTNSEEFKKQVAYLKDKKKFEKTDAFKKQTKFKTLAADTIVKFVLKYEKSALYKNYLDVNDSFDLKRYNELDKLVRSDEFKERKAWLEDKKRWEKTEEFKKQQQYEQEKGKPKFVNYFKYKDSSAFDFLKNWHVVFEDSFSGSKLNPEKWVTAFPTANKLLGENYAMPGDLNIFTNGENINVSDKLSIHVKKEKATGKVWQMPAGFVPTDFEYTSGMVSTGDKFVMDNGVLEAKVKFTPVKQVASSLYLSGDESTPRINLVEMGAKNNVGISSINNRGKIENSGLDISNLKKGEYIFTLEKIGATFTWKINETEVWQQTDNSLNKPLQINASSLVIDQLKGAPSGFEIEWVKCFQKR